MQQWIEEKGPICPRCLLDATNNWIKVRYGVAYENLRVYADNREYGVNQMPEESSEQNRWAQSVAPSDALQMPKESSPGDGSVVQMPDALISPKRELSRTQTSPTR